LEPSHFSTAPEALSGRERLVGVGVGEDGRSEEVLVRAAAAVGGVLLEEGGVPEVVVAVAAVGGTNLEGKGGTSSSAAWRDEDVGVVVGVGVRAVPRASSFRFSAAVVSHMDVDEEKSIEREMLK
jgi:hypothetical protein